MDIQETAVEQTRNRLSKEHLSDRAEVVLDTHVHMDVYADEGSVSLIMFNLGYLQGRSSSCDKGRDNNRSVEKGTYLTL